MNCCDNNISSSSKVGAHFQNLHTLVDLLLKFSDELLKNFFAMHKSVSLALTYLFLWICIIFSPDCIIYVIGIFYNIFKVL